MFIIEGLREISRANVYKINIKTIFWCPEIGTKESSDFIEGIKHTTEIIEVTSRVFSRIAYRENIDGLIALAESREQRLEDIEPGINPLILVLESLEKPGNLGAVLRSADAAGVTAVIVCDPGTDIYNPNTIRSSLGCIFSMKVIVCGSESALRFLQNRGIKIFSAALQDAVPYTEADFRCPSAIVLGSEARGLSHAWRVNADKIIRIPMFGVADSLNVSVSAAILVYEAVRQRGYDQSSR